MNPRLSGQVAVTIYPTFLLYSECYEIIFIKYFVLFYIITYYIIDILFLICLYSYSFFVFLTSFVKIKIGENRYYKYDVKNILSYILKIF